MLLVLIKDYLFLKLGVYISLETLVSHFHSISPTYFSFISVRDCPANTLTQQPNSIQ
jgi:hypothetical protein